VLASFGIDFILEVKWVGRWTLVVVVVVAGHDLNVLNCGYE